jgi:hypothetical protein
MKLTLVAVGALAALVVAGPLQHIGALPQNAVSDASKSMIKAALNFGASEALACVRGGPKGNNGWGNGENIAPGNSLANQPKFEDPNTGTSPSRSPRSGGGDR